MSKSTSGARRVLPVPARAALILLCAAALLAPGCARVPGGAAGPFVRRKLTVDFTVKGRVNPLYYYFVALDATGNTSAGPVPVVASPFGNGWVTGEVTHYVQLHLGNFGVFRFRPETDLLSSDLLGSPFEFNRPEDPPGNRVRVTLDVDSTLGTDVNLVSMNIITTDTITIEPTVQGTKLYDALGFSGNEFVTIPMNITQTFTNDQLTEPEGEGDVPPTAGIQIDDLDITGWRAEVQITQ